ncbi:MAG: GNAT family N-acetyltransferase [Bacteroidota bacterium]|nr:GNAT family N-acetyltransferase [Bacteroidota bacterium]
MENEKIIKKLEWDSDFFNINICRINNNISSHEDLKKVIKELKKYDIDLGYYSSVQPLKELNHNSEPYDITFVDKKVTYLKEIKNKHQIQYSITAYMGEYPNDMLINLAIQSGIYSRFNIDSRISRVKYEELYRQWIVNSVNKKFAKEVLVCYGNDSILGFITVGEKNLIADIGLIAVDANYRGKGIGKSLIYAAENWFIQHNYKQVQVITQTDNLSACKLYENCGYMKNKIEYFYHLWKK